MRHHETSRPSQASDEGVGSREQLVRVPVKHGRSLTSQLPRTFERLWWHTRASSRVCVRPSDGRRAHFTLRGAMAENGTRG